MRKFFHILSIFIIIFVFSSCATIFTGTSEKIIIKSTPNKAKVTIKTMEGSDVYNGATPIAIKLPKKHEYIVTVKMDGYEETNIQITKGFQGWFLGNILIGGIIGMIIDAADGAMWTLEPNIINISLATASNDISSHQTYAVFRSDDGQLKMVVIPMRRQQ